MQPHITDATLISPSRTTIMPRGLETKACNACATAKRKCGRQTPCLRCKRRDIECKYRPSKPTNFVLCEDEDASQSEQALVPYGTPESFVYSPGAATGAPDAVGMSHGPVHYDFSSSLFVTQLASSWFTSLETWRIMPFTEAELQSQLELLDPRRPIKVIQRWLAQWVQHGHNPFIHAQLYRARFPQCIQNAYTALSSYIHRTASNEEIILRIVRDRATELVANFDSPANSTPGKTVTSSASLDSLDHIARVQALLVYQCIGLFDGDIRLRHLTESHVPVLHRWMRQMADDARQNTCLGSNLTSQTPNTMPSVSDFEDLLWYTWIVAETVRRTWVISSGIQGLYSMTHQAKATSCSGGMMFTTRQGVWEAPSARAWEKLCCEVNVGLMQTAHTARLLTDVGPGDVDDLAKLVLELSFGADKMDRWELS